jgi:hypothetical protein
MILLDVKNGIEIQNNVKCRRKLKFIKTDSKSYEVSTRASRLHRIPQAPSHYTVCAYRAGAIADVSFSFNGAASCRDAMAKYARQMSLQHREQ